MIKLQGFKSIQVYIFAQYPVFWKFAQYLVGSNICNVFYRKLIIILHYRVLTPAIFTGARGEYLDLFLFSSL